MNCKNHKDIQAKYICDKCKMPICEDCAQDIRGNKVCAACVEKALYAQDEARNRNQQVNGFFFFILACIPGAAHMFMGLNKRGFQLMLAFIAAIPIFGAINVESIIPVIIIPTWFFSFFDSYSIRKKRAEGIPMEDNEVIDYNLIIDNLKYIGIAMIFFGIIGFANAFQFHYITKFFGIDLSNIIWSLKRSVVPLMLIFAGLLVLTKTKKTTDDSF